MPIELSTDPLREPVASCHTVMACLARLNSENGAAPLEADQRGGDLGGETLSLSRVVELAAEFGFRAERAELDWSGLKATGFTHPILVLRKDNDAVIVTGDGRAGAEEVSVWDPHHDGVVFFVPREDFERYWNGHALIMNSAEPQTPFDAGSTTSPGAADFLREEMPANPVQVARSLRSNQPADPSRRLPRLRVWVAAVTLVAISGLGAYYLTHRERPPSGVAANASARAAPEPIGAAAPLTSVEPTDAFSLKEPVGAAPSAAEIAGLLDRGDALFRRGDLAAARLFYERAANAGDGQAAIRLGETFDPVFLEHAQLRGARGDINSALSWYRRARDLGATEAELLLRSLEGKKDQ